MASIRRTLSPVPRQGTSLSGEVCASPLSKSSSCTHNQPLPGGILSSLLGLSDSHALLLGVLSPRFSRTPERSKSKGQVWRRALFHFFICFTIGVFIGFTPFSSIDFSMNSVSKHQDFSFAVVSTAGKFQLHESTPKNTKPSVDIGVKTNATSKPQVKEWESTDIISYGIPVNQSSAKDSALVPQKLLIIVTPTFAQPFQAYTLNRLAQTLTLVRPPLLWIVVEMTSQTVETANILRKTGVMYRHLVCNKNLTDIKDRNVHQRNVALAHIETHQLDGIVYFADDDNIYSVDLFDQMRQIRRFGTWPVAKLTKNENKGIMEGPVCNGTQVLGWHTNESTRRFWRFHVEISGFAFNSTILWDPKRWHRPTIEPIRQLDTVNDGLQVSTFIEKVVEDESQMEGLPQDCRSLMVWQLHLESASPIYPNKWFLTNNLDVVSPLE